MASLLNWENATKKYRGLVLLLSLRTGTARLLLWGRKPGLSPMQRSGKDGVWSGLPTRSWEILPGRSVTGASRLPASGVGWGFISHG